MFSKILAGALGVSVIAVGGVVYYQYGMTHESKCCLSRGAQTETTSCCGDLSRTDAVSACCSHEEPAAVSSVTEDGREVLSIAPREVAN